MINLNLTIYEINTIMGALGNVPYIQVHELITKIRSQVEPQIQNMPIEEPIQQPTE